MRVWHGVSEIDRDLGPTVVTIGNFDGVHRGHRHVIERARELAAELGGVPVIAVTFDPHPMRIVRPDHAPHTLSSVDERVELLGAAGADGVVVLPFTPDLAQLPPEEFVTYVVLGSLHAAGVVVGENFRFGYRAAGDVTLLTTMCEAAGAKVVGLPLDGAGDQTWSSSYVRARVAEGDVEAAAAALGRPFTVRGTVRQGDQRGRELGYPTANIPVSGSEYAVPADGVYAGTLRRLDEPGSPALPAAISVGTNPTFDGTDRRVESYVLDRTDLELYDVPVEVAFVKRLRGMVTFDGVDALLVQMAADVDQARELVGTSGVDD